MSCAIVIPAYNAAAYLGEAIDSALRQSVPAGSLVVVDDGSTDETPAICARYGDAVIALHQENCGVSAARNHGAAQVSAEWLLFLDADDRLLPDALEKLLTRSTRGACGVIYGQSVFFDDTNAPRITHGSARSEGPPPIGALASFWKSAISTPGAALIRASLFRELGGFDPAVDSLADRDFWLRAGALAEFGYTAGPVLEKRTHAANMSSDLDRAIPQAARVQLGFLDWCRSRGIDSTFLQTSPAAVIDNALRKGFKTRSLGGIAGVVALAADRGISAPLLRRARRLVAMPPTAARFELRLRAGWHAIAGRFAR